MTTTETGTTPKSVHAAWADVMSELIAISKGEKYEGQGGGFMFRGIDRVMNAVGPVLRENRVIVIPCAVSLESERYTTKGGTGMRNVTVQMQYTVTGPDGDSFVGSAYGEAADSGDKATSKAESVAYRTFLLQALTIPTHDPEPDMNVHERDYSEPTGNGRPRQQRKSAPDQARDDLMKVLLDKGYDPQEAVDKFASEYPNEELKDTTDVKKIRALIKHYVDMSEGKI